MKNILILLICTAVIFTACEDDQNRFDPNEGPSIAQFNGNNSTNTLIINPSENTRNTITVSVSTVSDVDRKAVVTVDANSSLDPSYYNIESELNNLIIPAGQYSTDIVITTPATDIFPSSGDRLVLNLISVAGGEVRETSYIQVAAPTLPACAFDASISAGTYTITVDGFETSVGDLTFDVVAGPGPNEVTMVSPFDHVNPDTNQADYDVVISVNPETGAARINKQPAWHCVNFGCGFGEGRIEGTGFVFSCIGKIQFNLKHTVDAGSFGTYAFEAVKN